MKNPYRLPDNYTQKSQKQIEKEVTIEEYMRAKAELDELQEKYGLEPEQGKISKAISDFFDRREAREKVKVNKKKDF